MPVFPSHTLPAHKAVSFKLLPEAGQPGHAGAEPLQVPWRTSMLQHLCCGCRAPTCTLPAVASAALSHLGFLFGHRANSWLRRMWCCCRCISLPQHSFCTSDRNEAPIASVSSISWGEDVTLFAKVMTCLRDLMWLWCPVVRIAALMSVRCAYDFLF